MEAGRQEEDQLVDGSCEEAVKGWCCVGGEESCKWDLGTNDALPLEEEGEEGVYDSEMGDGAVLSEAWRGPGKMAWTLGESFGQQTQIC